MTLAWLALVAIAMTPLLDYSNQPGAQASAPTRWPADSTITRSSQGPTLLFFAHPRCPCTKASLEELARLLAEAGAVVETSVIFYEPQGLDWPTSSLESFAHALPSVHVLRDLEATEAQRFGVQTSGQVLLYDESSQLQFVGGITRYRGHEGDNVGRTALRALLLGEREEPGESPVFGCTISEQCVPPDEAP